MFFSCYNHKPKFYFIGLGGVSMSALAKYLSVSGYEVAGSDKSLSDTILSLKNEGIAFYLGHDNDIVSKYDVVVYNSAISEDNFELLLAKSLNKIILKRVELLQMIISEFENSVGFCGCHGKTTSTSIFAHILYQSNANFTAHIGGFDLKFNNLFVSGKDIITTEVCEFDKNINYITTKIAVALNIDNDHLNSYLSFDELKDSYFNYLQRGEKAIVNIDDKILSTYKNKNKITYSAKNIKADYFVKKIYKNNSEYFVFYKAQKRQFSINSKRFFNHDCYNLLATVCVAFELGLEKSQIIAGIKSYKGVKRRNELIGELFNTKVIADYAHHPKEIESTINSYKKKYNDLFVVFQPHTYSRTKLLYNEFLSVLSNVEKLLIYKTFPARENKEQGVSADELAKALFVPYFDDINELFVFLKKVCQKHRTILILGAGDLYDEFKKILKVR